MTTNRIDHTGHNHPATPVGRAACRKALAKANRPIQVGDVVIAHLDDASPRPATVVSIVRWGTGFRYNCRFASGRVYGTCRVEKI